MAAKLGSLIIDVSANVAKITRDMGKIQKNVSRSFKTIDKAISVTKGLIAAAFTGQAIKAVIDYSTELIDAADKMDELAITTGIAVDELSKLEFVATQSKGSIEVLANGLRILSKNVDDTSMGIGIAQTAFNRLGVDVRDSAGNLKPIDDLFGEIADSMGNLGSTTEQSAVAQKLFGRSGAQLLPILKKGSAGISELKKEAEDLGIVLSKDFAENSASFNDSLDKIGKSFDGFARTLFGPEISAISTGLNDFVEIIKVFNEVGELDTGRVNEFIDSIITLGAANFPILSQLPGFQSFIKNDLEEATQKFKQIVAEAKRLSEALEDEKDLDGILSVLDGIGTIEGKLKDLNFETKMSFGEDGVLGDLERSLNDASEGVRDGFIGVENALRDGAASLTSDDLTNNLSELTKPVLEFSYTLDDTAEKANDSFREIASAAGEITSSIVDLANGAEFSFSKMTQSILSDILRIRAQKFFTSILTGMFTSAPVDTSNDNLMSELERVPLPGYANGGVVTSPTLAMVGEGGGAGEAMLPLMRKGGKMGVMASGGGTTVNIINNTSSQITTESRTNGDGVEELLVFIDNRMNENVLNGSIDTSMRQAYNIERVAFNR